MITGGVGLITSRNLDMPKQTKITKSAKDCTCIRCGNNIEGGVWACHYNGFRSHRYGKGMRTKCHDLASAEFCMQCDELFSEKNYHLWEGGSKSTERSEEFLHWVTLTNIRRFERGTLRD